MTYKINSLGNLVSYDDFSYCYIETNGDMEIKGMREDDEVRFGSDRWTEISNSSFWKKFNRIVEEYRDKGGKK